MTLIQEGDNVLIRMPSNNCKIVTLKSASKVNLGKFGTFNASALIGQPFNAAYNIIANGEIESVNPSAAMEDLDEEIDEDEAAERNNSNLKDREENQKVSKEEIDKMKLELQDGTIDAKDIIKTLVTNNSSHDQKTKFAQLKFIKRKARKYSKKFEALETTTRNLCEYYFTTKPQKTRGIRVDTLAQIMCFANVMASSNILVADSVGGLVVGSLLERMTQGSQGFGGKVFAMMDGDMPNFDLVNEMNLDKSVIEKTLDYLSWSRFEKGENEGITIPPPETADPNSLLRHTKKVAAIAKTIASRTVLQQPNHFDGLIIASQFENLEILGKLIPYVGYSRPVVIYSQFKESLVPAYLMMRGSPDFVNAQLSETLTREYQVPVSGLGTHPFMQTSGGGGFLLTATRVFAGDEPVAAATQAHKEKKKGSNQHVQATKKRKL
ncbi:UNVERIFIED_CONTAM: tRNA (adenine(58)-N(1))-methyltransferase non-catalytic subunit trm6 [Siphonaria sp. JEL0065]|nr:tRNA (adenine(58)-N(1))-methyltransferase non-catalytic subunit trm6 [Siphonaria sp. JEL0065]